MIFISSVMVVEQHRHIEIDPQFQRKQQKKLPDDISINIVSIRWHGPGEENTIGAYSLTFEA